MRINQCGTCKHGKSMYEKRGIFFDQWDRFFVVCEKLDDNEITPVLHNFIATCGCASWESGE